MESKEGSGALFQYATEGILVTNDLAEIVRINPSAEKLFGYAKGELLGQKIEVLIPSRFGAMHVNHRNGFIENPHARSMGIGFDLSGIKKDGSEFPVEVSLSPYKNDEKSYVIAFIIDTSLRKQSEEKMKYYSKDLEKQVKDRTLIYTEAIKELKKTKSELYDALEKERELNEMKSRFVSMASHEFRTPLTTILSSLSLISIYHDRNDSDKLSTHVRKIENSIGNLTDILNDFLSVGKMEEGMVENIPEFINIKKFAGEIVSEMQAITTLSHELVHQHSGLETVFIDIKLLKHILLNVISNAAKFSPDGGKIEVATTVDSNQILISVADHGIGISKTDQEHLFERFFRGQNAIHIQGTGLGLNIVASYAEVMNGRVKIESEIDKGTKITFLFPNTIE